MKRKPICLVQLTRDNYDDIQLWYAAYRTKGSKVLGATCSDIYDLIRLINRNLGTNKSERTLRRIWRNEYERDAFPEIA
jgi:hypothetical protein